MGKLLSRLFGYSKNRKNITRKMSNKGISDKTENKENKKKEKFMENESVNQEIEKKETDTENKTENVETKEVVSHETVKKGEEKSPEENVEQVENTEEQPATLEVLDTEPSGNGIRVEDLVTKDELAERFAALEAKFEAVVKENKDLKDKYENKDFGNYQKQGMLQQDQNAEETFESYSKNFM